MLAVEITCYLDVLMPLIGARGGAECGGKAGICVI
jgi:hypothetical protein